jgi:hypothetical protein
MEKLTWVQREEILDYFGKEAIVRRDRTLEISMSIAKRTTVNTLKKEKYKSFSTLTEKQQEDMCDLLSETITDTIYEFLEMFEECEDKMELIIKKDGKEYNMVEISEKMGSEIACYEDDGWIQKFSKIGRFVL